MDGKERKELNRDLRIRFGEQPDPEKVVKAQQTVMSQNEDMRADYWKSHNCSSYRPCNLPTCTHCGWGVPFREYPKKPEYMIGPDFGDCLRGKSRNFRANAGRGATGVFDGFEPEQTHALTIGIYFGTKTLDCLALNRSFRENLRSIIRKAAPDAVVYLVGDIAIENAKTFGIGWPDSARAHELDDPAVKAGLYLHAHGFIAVQGLTREQLRAILKAAFPGNRRITMSDPLPEYFDENGRLQGGKEGYIEYAAMEKSNLDQPDGDKEYDNVAMFEALYRARKAWPRNARKTKINHKKSSGTDSRPLALTGTVDFEVSHGAKVIEFPLSAPVSRTYKWSSVGSQPIPLVFMMKAMGLDVTFFGKTIRARLTDFTVRLEKSRRVGSISG